MGCDLAAFEVSADGLPRDEVADRVALIERVHEVADFDAVPHEGSLKLGNGDVLTPHVLQQLRDGRLGDLVRRHALLAPYPATNLHQLGVVCNDVVFDVLALFLIEGCEELASTLDLGVLVSLSVVCQPLCCAIRMVFT